MVCRATTTVVASAQKDARGICLALEINQCAIMSKSMKLNESCHSITSIVSISGKTAAPCSALRIPRLLSKLYKIWRC